MSTRRALLLVALAALLIRLAIWPWFAPIQPRIYDEDDYVDLATSLAERGEFAMNGQVTSARPPLYPAMVAAVFRVAGIGNLQAVRLLQIVLNVALIPLVFLLGRRLYDQRTGVVAAILAAFYPSLLGHDYLLLTEVTFTFLLVAGTVAAIENAARPRWVLIALAGLLFGLGTLTRTSLLFYPALFAIATFALDRAPSARRITAVLAFTAVFALTLAPWIARNTKLHGRLSSVDSYSNSTAAALSGLRHLFEEPGSTWATRPYRERTGLAPPPRPTRKEEQDAPGAAPGASFGVQVARSVSDTAWDALLFWRIDRELAGAAARGWLGPLPRPAVVAVAVIVALYYVALMIAAAIGLVLRPPRDRLHLALALSPVAVLFAVHAFSIGHSRYHIPVIPLVAVFAARLWVARGEPVAWRRLAAGLVVASILVASWTAAFVRDDLPDARNRWGAAGERRQRGHG